MVLRGCVIYFMKIFNIPGCAGNPRSEKWGHMTLEKNKSLKPTGQKICVNVKTAYQTNMVPITTTSNLLQDEILTHLVFDTGNSTKNCNKQIELRLQNIIKAQ